MARTLRPDGPHEARPMSLTLHERTLLLDAIEVKVGRLLQAHTDPKVSDWKREWTRKRIGQYRMLAYFVRNPDRIPEVKP